MCTFYVTFITRKLILLRRWKLNEISVNHNISEISINDFLFFSSKIINFFLYSLSIFELLDQAREMVPLNSTPISIDWKTRTR